MGHLKGLANLTRVSLSETQISDAGLMYLNRLTNLESLDLRSTRVTDSGVAKLKQTLPNCSVIK